MLPKTHLRPLRALFALRVFALLATLATAAFAAPAPAAPTPAKSEVLAAIAAIEKDPLGEKGLAAGKTIALFAINSDKVNLVISDLTAPWMSEPGNPDDPDAAKNAPHTLLDSYIAGYLQSQLKNEPPVNYPRSGWLFVIRTYKQLAAKTKLSFPSIDRLAMLESNGWLAEYSQVVVKEISENAAAWNTKIPASKKLTRDYLAPANGLRNKGKYNEAYALYAAWLAQNPDDAEAHFDYGYAMTLQADGENNKKTAASLIKKSRSHILLAAALGAKNSPLSNLLNNTAPNYDETKESPFSKNKKANDLITQAEKAFAQKHFDDAAKLYQTALEYDPKSYTATLYTGDAYFYAEKLPSAIEWFKKAIALDPNVETAHRYP